MQIFFVSPLIMCTYFPEYFTLQLYVSLNDSRHLISRIPVNTPNKLQKEISSQNWTAR